MKYKVEFWPYGEFDTAEAAERLNRRAGEGWELVNVVTLFVWGAFGMALYRRNPAAAEYRYATDILPNDNCQGYIDFCGDAGWEKVLKMGQRPVRLCLAGRQGTAAAYQLGRGV